MYMYMYVYIYIYIYMCIHTYIEICKQQRPFYRRGVAERRL